MKKITIDKYVHFFASAWLTFALLIALNGNLPLAVGLAFGVGIAKEVYDEFIKGTGFNLIDLTYNFFGIFISVLIYMVFNN